MAGNSNLRNANAAKKDEFYTQLSDIEKEMRHYKEYFKNKTIFCIAMILLKAISSNILP